MRAAAYGYPEIVQILVTHGANVNAVNSRGRTALMFAYEHDTMMYGEYFLIMEQMKTA
jgi:ankyrin repeat protein